MAAAVVSYLRVLKKSADQPDRSRGRSVGRKEGIMADQYSFDVVSEVNMQELRNVVDQATKEVKQRFDFKDSKTEITLKEKEKELVIVSDNEYKLNAVIDIVKTKSTKRGVSLKAFTYGTIEPALGGTVRQVAKIQSGIVSEKAKEITKAVKESKLKVQAQIQGEQLRVQGKSKDELQATMTLLKGKDFGIDLQFTNYR
jgi:cyclic-di-GMP-binding protein